MVERWSPVARGEVVVMFVPVRWYEGLGHDQPFNGGEEARQHGVSLYVTVLLCLLTFLVTGFGAMLFYTGLSVGKEDETIASSYSLIPGHQLKSKDATHGESPVLARRRKLA